MSGIAGTHIYCSDLQRCRETLEHVLNAQPCKVTVHYTPQLQERYMAELQGVSKEVVEQLCREQKKTKFDFGESTKDLTFRVETFWRDHILPLYGDQASGNKNSSTAIFVCSHGGTLLHLTNVLLTTFRFKLADGVQITRASPNTGVTILDTDSMVLEVYADISHLNSMGSDEVTKDERMEVVDV